MEQTGEINNKLDVHSNNISEFMFAKYVQYLVLICTIFSFDVRNFKIAFDHSHRMIEINATHPIST